MKKIYFVLICFVLVFASCNKDNSSSGGGASGTGKAGSMARFAIKDNFLYVVDNNTLKLFNIDNPSEPRYMPGRDQGLNFGVETIFVMDSLLFIGSTSGMYIYDVKNPGYPNRLSFVSHINSCDPVVANGNYAYVTLNTENRFCGRNTNEIRVYDITNVNYPVLKKRVETGNTLHPKGLGIEGDRLFVCFNNGLRVYDISNPENPTWITGVDEIPGLESLATYDVIPLNDVLLIIGADGFYQLKFDRTTDKLTLLSKIEVQK